MNPVEQYFLNQKEPFQSLMLYVRSVIKRALPAIEEKYSYGIPMYHYKKIPLVYINVLKGTDFLDIAFLHGVKLVEFYPELKDYKKRKKVRSIHLKSIEALDEKRFVAMLLDASELIEISRSVRTHK